MSDETRRGPRGGIVGDLLFRWTGAEARFTGEAETARMLDRLIKVEERLERFAEERSALLERVSKLEGQEVGKRTNNQRRTSVWAAIGTWAAVPTALLVGLLPSFLKGDGGTVGGSHLSEPASVALPTSTNSLTILPVPPSAAASGAAAQDAGRSATPPPSRP